MKKTFLALAGFVAFSAMTISCSGGQKSENTVTASDSVATSAVLSDTSLKVDSASSYLTWRGFKPGGEHFGKLPVTSGEVSIADSKLFGGNVTIAMNGIIVEDLQGETAAQLKGHLESADFFEVEKFPTARFELTGVPAEGLDIATLKELQGNLTLKDVTKNITIPVASIETVAEGTKITSATFRINRADWNVKYGSKSFFTGLGDKFIDDEIELSFTLIAR